MSDLIDIEDLYENAPCGYFSFTPKGNIIKANKTFLNWTGISKDDLAETLFIDLLYKGNTIYYEMIFLPMLKMQGYLNEISFDIVRKNGSTFPGLINAVAVRNEQEDLKAINVTLINISDRKKFEQDLINAKKEADSQRVKFEILSNQVPDIIWTAKSNGEISFLNKQYYKETESKPQDLNSIKIYLADLIFSRDKASFLDRWNLAMEQQEPLEVEVRLKTSLSTPQWYLLRATPFVTDPYAENPSPSWFGTFTNIDHQMKSLHIKDEFIGIASHELKTPITVVKSYLQILEEVLVDKTQRTLLQKCESAVQSMQHLISRLLDITQINAEKLTLYPTKLDLVELATGCVNRIVETSSDHAIKVNGADNPIYVMADRLRMEQVLNNLLSNAIKYSPEAKEVILDIKNQVDLEKVTVTVTDFGIGIPEKDLEKVFDRYYRVIRPSYYQGWGLGLFIVQQIMKAHGSFVSVESKEGKGSSFSFSMNVID